MITVNTIGNFSGALVAYGRAGRRCFGSDGFCSLGAWWARIKKTGSGVMLPSPAAAKMMFPIEEGRPTAMRAAASRFTRGTGTGAGALVKKNTARKETRLAGSGRTGQAANVAD